MFLQGREIQKDSEETKKRTTEGSTSTRPATNAGCSPDCNAQVEREKLYNAD